MNSILLKISDGRMQSRQLEVGMRHARNFRSYKVDLKRRSQHCHHPIVQESCWQRLQDNLCSTSLERRFERSPIFDSEVGSGHGFVGAGLSLLATNRREDGLALFDVLLVGPAVDESVGNIRCHFNASSGHLLENWLGIGDSMVGDHGLEQCLVKTSLGSN